MVPQSVSFGVYGTHARTAPSQGSSWRSIVPVIVALPVSVRRRASWMIGYPKVVPPCGTRTSVKRAGFAEWNVSV